ncbi:MAG: SAM-dependent methyltransferase [Lachnospiraceae bacterium]|nr:SAM-dependent methyltransferase [Lachnospiraceae bacterium]
MTEKRPALSTRLRCITDCVRAVAARYASPPRLADIGCDHGLVPAELILTGDIGSAVASDVKRGPLKAARENAERFGIQDRMRFVCADGMDGVGQDAAEICVIAGMGGELIRDIVRKADFRAAGMEYLVLSPHTKAAELRRYLREAAFVLLSETMAEEEGRFYPVLTLSVPAPERPKDGSGDIRGDCYRMCTDAVCDAAGYRPADALRVAYAYGPVLLARRDAVLKRYLLKQRTRFQTLLEAAAGRGADAHRLRMQGRDADAALAVYREVVPERREHALQ